MQKIKAAVVGLGFIGPAHVEALRRVPTVDVIGALHFDLESSRQKTQELGIAKAYGSFE